MKPIQILAIAMVCHAANKVFSESNGDNTVPSWEDCPEEIRDVFIKGVNSRLAKPQASVSAAHYEWCADMTKDGWVYGEVKDFEAKTHPHLVPYSALPLYMQQNDSLFNSIVDALTVKEETANKQLSYGEKLVGIEFNPSNNDKVFQVKSLMAQSANIMQDDFESKETSSLHNRLRDHAEGSIVDGAMNVVKVLTFQH